MIHIGIDPDLQKPGVAIIVDGEYTALKSMPFPELVDFIAKHKGMDNVLFSIEDVNAHSPTFHRFQKKGSVQNNISQKVGMVKAVGKLIIDMIEHHGCQYELIKPLKGTLKKAKEDRPLFESNRSFHHVTDNPTDQSPNAAGWPRISLSTLAVSGR